MRNWHFQSSHTLLYSHKWQLSQPLHLELKRHYTRALALELSSSNIQVNAIAKGVIDTPLNAIHNAQDRENLAKMSPMGKIGNPQNIVDAAVYLTQSEFVTGMTMIVDGGASTGVW
ncbi:hypothetical protein B6D21_06185 [Gilliamella apis]|nr:hypothetical protein B6D21_06185 [Gilliamella apis]